MLSNVLTKDLWDTRRSQLGWTTAIVAVAVMYGAFWPSVQSPEMAAALEAYPQVMLKALDFDLTSAAGYLRGSVYGIIVPILMAIFGIAAGTRAVAGDEEAGTLDLILAHPVSRVSVALQRYGAILARLAVLCVAIFVAMVALSGPARFEGITVAEFAATNLQLALLGAFFAALAFAIGAATGSRGLALWGGAAVAVFAYVARALLTQVEGLEWVRNLSPFEWFIGGDPLTNGLQASGSLLLVGAAAALVAVGTFAFTRRDVAV